MKFWFEKTEDNNKATYKYFQAQLNFSMSNLINKVYYKPGLKSLANSTLHELKKLYYKRKLVKDPIALFSADWIYRNFDFQVVVLIRHPAAFAESLKNKNWLHNFNHFSNQEELMKELPDKLQKEILDICKENRNDIIEHAILLWNIIHYKIIKYKENYNNWIFVRHEDLSTNPVGEFAKLYKKLNLDFNEKARRYIDETSRAKINDNLHRDSKQNISKWKNNLSSLEISRIKESTNIYSREFYSSDDW